MNALTKGDTLSFIRRRWDIYLPEGVSELILAERLQKEARLLTGCEAKIQQSNGWWLVSCPHDWLRIGRYLGDEPSELFDRAFAFPESGVNTVRSEIVVAAFASDVFINTPEQYHVIQGGEPPDAVLEACREEGRGRTVGFRLGDPSKDAV
jgi:hypothetical protein